MGYNGPMEILRVVKKDRHYAVVMNGTQDGGFIVYYLRPGGALGLPVTDAYQYKFDAFAKLFELEIELQN
jgi:hypothetical protein